MRTSVISGYITNIYNDEEIEKDTIVSKKETNEKGEQVEYFNLEMIIPIGYRVNSIKGTKFRTWATKQLKELITDGFVIDDNRFAKGQLAAFQKLVDRVREIRTSERHFYSKIQDIFATSSNYDSNSNTAKNFFATMQNKFHYAIHGHTAADLIKERIDSDKINMGLTAYKGKDVTMADAKIAKNYLSELEIKRLELLSEQFLSFAELRYYDKKHMTMEDWERKLNEFLVFNEKEVLSNKGKVSAMDMLQIVE
ncbi:MAG: virulence RhuM family protein, partial [Methylococcaceae bacterium]|nr:virulence RhuM family protein [Methylococcaceae bacterium]